MSLQTERAKPLTGRATEDRASELRHRIGVTPDRMLLEEALAEIERQALQLGRRLLDKEESLAYEQKRRWQLERESVSNDRFASVVSHDLRALTNALLGWIQLLRREHLDTSARTDVFERLDRIAAMQLTLIDAFVDIPRIAGDRVRFELVRVDVARLVHRVVARLAAPARSAGIDLTVAADSPEPYVTGDPARLEHVVERLVTNALRFTREGGRVWVRVEDNPPGRVRLTVQDDGRGIGFERLPTLFDGVQPNRNRNGCPTGLGLFIVRRIVELHDGTVTASSDGTERGSRFIVDLPASR